MKLGIGADHGGFVLKEEIKKALSHASINFIDYGTFDDNPSDYPDIARRVVSEIQEGRINRAILICGTGIGMSVQANRFKEIRAALCYNEYTAEMARKHNNSNILVLGGRTLDNELAKKILHIWLNTEFEGGRHERRIKKIDE